MAIIKFSGLVTVVKGKLNGSVLQGSAYGNIIRSNGYGRRSQTTAAYTTRSRQSYVTRFCRSLTLEERDSMAAAAQFITRPTKSGPATPYDWWSFALAFNGKLAAIDENLIRNGFAAPELSDIAKFTVSYTPGTNYFLIIPPVTGLETEKVIIRCSAPVSLAYGYRASRMRTVSIQVCHESTYRVSFASLRAVFGTASPLVARWFDMQIVNRATGFFSPVATFKYFPL